MVSASSLFPQVNNLDRGCVPTGVQLQLRWKGDGSYRETGLKINSISCICDIFLRSGTQANRSARVFVVQREEGI